MAKEQLFKSYLSTAVSLVRRYPGKTPFSIFLKEYFSAEKKYGSRDRKWIAQLCFAFFRTGKALLQADMEQKMLLGLFFISSEPNILLEYLLPSLNKRTGLPLTEKIRIPEFAFETEAVFPWQDEISESIDKTLFSLSHLRQPFLFLRIRPGFRKQVFDALENSKIIFQEVMANCLAVDNTTRIDELLTIDRQVVIQDFNSQRVGGFIRDMNLAPAAEVWDCCAASGGKSLLAYDVQPELKLTVSDIRKNILSNLRNRFARAGIKTYSSFMTDLSEPGGTLPSQQFDCIIADLPCTGSGTWSRTPEQLFTFDPESIASYAALQKSMLKNLTGFVTGGGFLLYITCSVFKKENEEIVIFLQNNLNMHLVKMEMLKGYEQKADTLFVALFRKPS